MRQKIEEEFHESKPWILEKRNEIDEVATAMNKNKIKYQLPV